MSTSIIGFLDKNKKFVLFGADSRSIEPEFGEVVDDDHIKIYNLCHDFLATGAGDRDIIESIFISVDKESLHKPPQTVNEVAQLVASCGTELIRLSNHLPPEKTPPSFLIVGAKGGCCDMFTVLCGLEATTDNDTGKDINKETYVAKQAEMALLGHGKNLMIEQLAELDNYPIHASTPLEAKEVMKKAMYRAKRYDFCTGGKFRVVALHDDGTRSCSTATPLDESPDSQFGEWVEDEFSPCTAQFVFIKKKTDVGTS